MGYTFSKRTVDYNPDAFLALVPMANASPTGAIGGSYSYLNDNGLTGYGLVVGYAATTGNANLFFLTSKTSSSSLIRPASNARRARQQPKEFPP